MQIVKESLGSDTAAYLQGYLRATNPDDDDQTLPAVIIIPGGSYTHIPQPQTETLALAFFNLGYQAFFLRYSVVDEKQPLYPAPLVELAKSFSMLRAKSADWHVDFDRVAVAGFSVGGQVAALYNDYWDAPWLAEQAGAKSEEFKPAAVILGYPEISPKLGFPVKEGMLEQWTDDPDSLAADEHVTATNAPTFIWVTADDPLVPSTNSLAYATALSQAKVPYELHVFRHGPHGLALANHLTAWKREANQPHVAHWVTLVEEWLNDTL
ncbi:alpha/beta hydrolase [Secundilactobacillus folii]|uniref:Alpha/beta hydrolase fold domain-containing protein n=1 Tax=Secundilactobacillus folii TaxID=2678357 RepID=A0A7X3C2J2_9LACO|nr:alpha/beta hydrolase [Secundilactobacillus folii]MTV81867.1 alpha/beta hydrolase fold domain-containing protein [Secundilactobacillus folii]